MATTPFQLATAVTYNGTGVNGWTDPNNILLVNGQFAVASGVTNVLQVGIFNLNIPQDSTLTNFTIKVKGYRGSFNTTLQLYLVDNSTGVDISYPIAPFQGFSGTNTLYTLPSTLGTTTWTSDQANNIQIKLIADGELHMDSIELSADYVANVTPVPVPPSTGQVVVDEFVEAIKFNLAQSMVDTDIYCFLQSFNLPDGTPIQYADFHNNGITDEACLVIDQGVPGLEEQVVITAVDQDYNGSGLCRLSFGTLANRGLKFIYPYDSDPALIRNHGGTAEVVISNSARFYSRFLRKNQINALVSAPIIIEDEGAALVDPAHTLDFQGAGVVVVNDGFDSFKKIITIPGNGVNPPNVVSTSSATSGASQVPTLTWSHTSSGINRLLIVQVEAEAASVVTGVTYNGVALTQEVSTTNGVLRSEQWSLVAPPVGTYNIVVSVAPDSYLTCGAESYVSTDQVTPIGVTQSATGTSLAPSLVLVTGTDNSLIVDSLSTGTLPIAYVVGAGQSENWHITANPNVRQGASSVENAGSFPDNVTMSWAITQNTAWALTALEIRGVSSPGATDEKVKVSVTDTTPGFLNPKINLHSGDGSITVVTTITNPGANEILDFNITTLGGGGGGTTNLQVDSTPDNGTYGLLGGAVDGVNTTFTVSLAAYQAGKLIVTLNGLTQNQGVANDFVETNPVLGIFDFVIAPVLGSTIVVEYQTAASIAQTGIQWQDEGINLGAAGTVDTVDFTGAAVTATRVGDTVTVNITGGGSGTELSIPVAQVAHGFSVGDVIKSDGTAGSYALAQADSSVNAEVVGLVTVVVDANNFEYAKDIMAYTGAGIPAGTPGQAVFLDPAVAGAMTITEPTAVGEISKPVGVLITSAAEMNFTADYRGQILTGIGSTVGYASGYTVGSSAIQNAIQTHVITHNLGQIPKLITLRIQNTSAVAGGVGVSSGSASTDGGVIINNQQCVLFRTASANVPTGPHTTIGRAGDNGFTVAATLTAFDATTFTIEWAATVNVDGTPEYIWEVYSDGTGDGPSKKVGVGEVSDIQWFNMQLPFIGTAGGAPVTSAWDMNNIAVVNAPSYVELGSSEYISSNNNGYGDAFPNFGTTTGYQFSATAQLIFQAVGYVITTANENCGMGFDILGVGAANKIFAAQGTNIVSVGFIRDGAGVWSARAADGVGFTETPITVSLDATHVFRCEYDPGNVTPQARFYVDGVLVATITTTLPTAVASQVAWTVGNDGGCNTFTNIGCPSFAVEI